MSNEMNETELREAFSQWWHQNHSELASGPYGDDLHLAWEAVKWCAQHLEQQATPVMEVPHSVLREINEKLVSNYQPGGSVYCIRFAEAICSYLKECSQQAPIPTFHTPYVTFGQQAPVGDAPQVAPTVEQAIDSLVSALVESKGWTRAYADSIIRDAIDRKDAPQVAQIEADLLDEVVFQIKEWGGVDYQWIGDTFAEWAEKRRATPQQSPQVAPHREHSVPNREADGWALVDCDGRILSMNVLKSAYGKSEPPEQLVPVFTADQCRPTVTDCNNCGECALCYADAIGEKRLTSTQEAEGKS